MQKAVLLVMRQYGVFSADKGIRLTYQACAILLSMFLGYICYAIPNTTEKVTEKPRNRDNDKYHLGLKDN